MQSQTYQQDRAYQQEMSTANQLRPVVIFVISAKLAVFALLMTTVQFHAPVSPSVEMADLR